MILNELNGDEYAVVTVNLNHPLQSDDMAFLDENNYPGIGKWIEKNRLGLPMGVIAASGYCRYRLYTLFILIKKESSGWGSPSFLYSVTGRTDVPKQRRLREYL